MLGDPGFQQEILKGDLATGGALVAGILNIGLILGGLSAGSSEGRLGRRYIMLIGLLITSVAGFGCAVVPNVGLFALCRFAAGIGIGPVLASTAPLATELSPPKERGFVVSVANSFCGAGKTETVTGMDPFETQDFLKALLEEAVRDEFAYVHEWTLGDLLIVDNRSAMHKAGADYDMAEHRKLYRTMVRGDRPY